MRPIDTPASVANRIDERPCTTAIQVPGLGQSNGTVIHSRCAANMPEHRETAREIDAGDAARAR